MKKYKVIGIMSGTSLDGLDIAYCEFEKKRNWEYKIIYAETKKYTKEWKSKLSDAFRMGKVNLKKTDLEYGEFIGKEVLSFIRQNKILPHFICSHGHTVFHQPEKKITVQIGSGPSIASICNLPVIYDFRIGDVMLGGQGAPLVPLVDKILFSGYEYCLNLGGFANISFDTIKGKRIAYDICPVNIVLNNLANQLGKEFDVAGKSASKGKIQKALLKKMNSLPFYKNNPPKSLGREWVEKNFIPIIDSSSISIQDKLRTVIEHIAIQISFALSSKGAASVYSKLFITGGGVYNKFLIERISAHIKCKIVLPDDATIQFKEAMAFAFLGVLKMRKEVNILKSVTGAKKDSSGGRIYSPHQNADSSS